jgi:hypothetical protein
MNVNGTQTPPASLAVSPGATMQPKVTSDTTLQKQSVSEAKGQRGIRDLSNRIWLGIGYRPAPPSMPSPSYPNQNAMIGRIQQTLEMLMRMLRGYLNPPQPPSITLPGMPAFDINSLVGRQAGEAQGTALKEGVSEVRVIPYGMPYTQDYQSDRLNLHLDRSGKVTRAHWG